MPNLTRITALIFDAKMYRILLLKGHLYFPMHIDMHGIDCPKDILIDHMVDTLGIEKISQPTWWLMRTEHRKEGSYDLEEQIFFAKLSDAEFKRALEIVPSAVTVPTGITVSNKRIVRPLWYLVPMAIYLADVPHQEWPKP